MIMFYPIQKAAKKPPPHKSANIDLERAMLRATDSTTPRASVTIVNSLKKFANGLTLEQIEALLHSGALDRDAVNLPWQTLEDLLANGIQPELVRAIKAGAEAANQFTTRAISAALGVEPVLTFDATNRRVQNYIKRSTAELVKSVTRESKNAVKVIVDEALSAPDFDVIDVFRAVKRSVPLDSRRAQAVENYRQNLLDGDDKPKRDIDKLVSNYADAQLKARANTITRTELMDAVNQGQLEGVKQAREAGWLKGTTVYKQWMITIDDRTCPTCLAMDGIKVPVDSPFDVELLSAKGKSRGSIKVDKPPAHPNCRCIAQTVIE